MQLDENSMANFMFVSEDAPEYETIDYDPAFREAFGDEMEYPIHYTHALEYIEEVFTDQLTEGEFDITFTRDRWRFAFENPHGQKARFIIDYKWGSFGVEGKSEDFEGEIIDGYLVQDIAEEFPEHYALFQQLIMSTPFWAFEMASSLQTVTQFADIFGDDEYRTFEDFDCTLEDALQAKRIIRAFMETTPEEWKHVTSLRGGDDSKDWAELTDSVLTASR